MVTSSKAAEGPPFAGWVMFTPQVWNELLALLSDPSRLGDAERRFLMQFVGAGFLPKDLERALTRGNLPVSANSAPIIRALCVSENVSWLNENIGTVPYLEAVVSMRQAFEQGVAQYFESARNSALVVEIEDGLSVHTYSDSSEVVSIASEESQNDYLSSSAFTFRVRRNGEYLSATDIELVIRALALGVDIDVSGDIIFGPNALHLGNGFNDQVAYEAGEIRTLAKKYPQFMRAGIGATLLRTYISAQESADHRTTDILKNNLAHNMQRVLRVVEHLDAVRDRLIVEDSSVNTIV